MADDQGLGLGTWAALAGVAVNFLWNFINFLSNRTTRRKAAQLSDFNTQVRNPINEALKNLDTIMDDADDIVRSVTAHDAKLKSIADLSKKFHAARRSLARRLNDCDSSALVDGDDWGACDEGHMDEATAAFDDAFRSPDDAKLRKQLETVVVSINSLRTELQRKLDAEAKRLMS